MDRRHLTIRESPPPSETLVGLPAGEALLYIDKLSTLGTPVVALSTHPALRPEIMPASHRWPEFGPAGLASCRIPSASWKRITADIYTHVREALQSDAAERVAEIIFGPNFAPRRTEGPS